MPTRGSPETSSEVIRRSGLISRVPAGPNRYRYVVWKHHARTPPPPPTLPNQPEDHSASLASQLQTIHAKNKMLLQELAIDRYTFPNSSPRYGNENLSYLARDFSYTSTDVSTEDELDESEDGSTSIGISHFTTGTRQCQTCGTSGTWHMPRDCLAVSRCCR